MLIEKIKNNNSGFTLIEIIIFNGILAIFLVSSFLMISSTLQIVDQAKAKMEVSTNMELVVKKIESTLISTNSVNIPAANSTSTTQLSVAQAVGQTPVIFALSNGALTISRGGGAPVSITNSLVTVTSFIAEQYSTATNPSVLKVTITMKSASSSADAKNAQVTSKNFYIIQ